MTETLTEFDVETTDDDGLDELAPMFVKSLTIIPEVLYPVKVTGEALDPFYMYLDLQMTNGDLLEYYYRCSVSERMSSDDEHYVKINGQQFNLKEDAEANYEVRQLYLKYKGLLPKA